MAAKKKAEQPDAEPKRKPKAKPVPEDPASSLARLSRTRARRGR